MKCLAEFFRQYPDEEACVRALYAARWPNGFRCPRCHCSQAYVIKKRQRWICTDCKYQASLTAGTVFEYTRTPLIKWFQTMYLIAHTSGINAIHLQQIIQVTYKTAWRMMTMIRDALNHAGNETFLSGIVHMNAAIYGKKLHADSQNLIQGEHLVVIGGSVDKEGVPEHIKIKQNPEKHTYKAAILPSGMAYFQERYVRQDATEVRSEYKRFSRSRFRSLLAIVKHATTWVHRTYGGIGGKYLQAYLDEFCFRYNHSRDRNKTLEGQTPFEPLLKICASHPHPHPKSSQS